MRLVNPDQPPHGRFFDFVIWGGLNTVATYALYLLLASLVHYQLAYLVSYVAGIALAYILNLRLVFRAESSGRKIALYPLIYVVQYCLGAALLYFLVSVLNLSAALAPLLVVAMLLPASYFMNRRLLTDDLSGKTADK